MRTIPALLFVALSPSLQAGPITISADDAHVRINGEAAQDWLGAAIAVAGDVNNDGRSDVICGAPVSDSASSQRPGKAYIHDAVTGDLLRAFNGFQNGDKFGASVAGIGDLNGDGHAEVIVGAPGYDGRVEGNILLDTGRAYVFSGIDGELMHTFSGEAAGDWFGFSVASIGDVDDDAISDFAVGARSPSNGRLGFVYIYSGATRGQIRVLHGEAGGTHFGYAVTGGGDINNDGIPDLLVSAPFHPAAGFFGGRVYAFSGGNGEVLHTFTGEGQSNFFGDSIAIVGDANGDSHADVLIGADGNSAGGNTAGRAYLFSGLDGSLLRMFTGAEIRGRLGRSVSAVGDVNGDQRADLLIGQPAPASAGGSGIARAFLFDGSSGSLLATFVATEHNDFFAFSMCSGHDLTGGGTVDVVIGAMASHAGGTQSGRIDIFHNPFTAPKPNPADIDGDGQVGVPDLLLVIGNWGRCPTQPQSCAADIAPPSGDGFVGVPDLLQVIANWGGRS